MIKQITKIVLLCLLSISLTRTSQLSRQDQMLLNMRVALRLVPGFAKVIVGSLLCRIFTKTTFICEDLHGNQHEYDFLQALLRPLTFGRYLVPGLAGAWLIKLGIEDIINERNKLNEQKNKTS